MYRVFPGVLTIGKESVISPCCRLISFASDWCCYFDFVPFGCKQKKMDVFQKFKACIQHSQEHD